mgnify:CR=1 FL=1
MDRSFAVPFMVRQFAERLFGEGLCCTLHRAPLIRGQWRVEAMKKQISSLEEAVEALTELQEERGISIAELGDWLDIDRAGVSRWLSGRRVPSLERWLQLLSVLGGKVNISVGSAGSGFSFQEQEHNEKEEQPEPTRATFFEGRPHLQRWIARRVREGHPEREVWGWFRRSNPQLTIEGVRHACSACRRRL